jgi:hypothetical protein
MKTALSGLFAAVIFCTAAAASEPGTPTATPPDLATRPIEPQAGPASPGVAPTNTENIGRERGQDGTTASPAQPLVQTEHPKDSQKNK